MTFEIPNKPAKIKPIPGPDLNNAKIAFEGGDSGSRKLLDMALQSVRFENAVYQLCLERFEDIPVVLHEKPETMPYRVGSATRRLKQGLTKPEWFVVRNRVWDGKALHLPDYIYETKNGRAVFLLTHEIAHHYEARASGHLDQWNYGLEDGLDIERELRVLEMQRSIYEYVDCKIAEATDNNRADYLSSTARAGFMELVTRMERASEETVNATLTADRKFHWQKDYEIPKS